MLTKKNHTITTHDINTIKNKDDKDGDDGVASNTCDVINENENECAEVYNNSLMILKNAQNLESLLVSFDRLSYINTAVKLCENKVLSNIREARENEENDNNDIKLKNDSLNNNNTPYMLSKLREMIKTSMTPSLQNLNNNNTSSSYEKVLFNSKLYATDLTQAFQAMKEVKHAYEEEERSSSDNSPLGTSLVLPHIFFGRTTHWKSSEKNTNEKKKKKRKKQKRISIENISSFKFLHTIK